MKIVLRLLVIKKYKFEENICVIFAFLLVLNFFHFLIFKFVNTLNFQSEIFHFLIYETDFSIFSHFSQILLKYCLIFRYFHNFSLLYLNITLNPFEIFNSFSTLENFVTQLSFSNIF